MARTVKDSTVYRLGFESLTYCILHQTGPFSGMEEDDRGCWEEIHAALEKLMWDMDYSAQLEARAESADAAAD